METLPHCLHQIDTPVIADAVLLHPRIGGEDGGVRGAERFMLPKGRSPRGMVASSWAREEPPRGGRSHLGTIVYAESVR